MNGVYTDLCFGGARASDLNKLFPILLSLHNSPKYLAKFVGSILGAKIHLSLARLLGFKIKPLYP